LSEALGMYREALRVLPGDHPEVPGMLSSIGSVLMTQGMQNEDPALLDEAVQSGRDAVAASSPGSPAHATRLAGLGRALIARFAHRGWPASDLDEAEQLFRQALDSLPAAHPLRAQVQNYLAGVTALRSAT
jgi:tetratricopeptide (TPR) repeat protein